MKSIFFTLLISGGLVFAAYMLFSMISQGKMQEAGLMTVVIDYVRPFSSLR